MHLYKVKVGILKVGILLVAILLTTTVFSSCVTIQRTAKQNEEEKMGMLVILPIEGELMKWKDRKFFVIEKKEFEKLKKDAVEIDIPPINEDSNSKKKEVTETPRTEN